MKLPRSSARREVLIFLQISIFASATGVVRFLDLQSDFLFGVNIGSLIVWAQVFLVMLPIEPEES